MAIQTLTDAPWRRFHDPGRSTERKDVHCVDDPADFIELCRNRPATGLKLKAAGSHWSLSESTRSDNASIETNWPDTGTSIRNSGLMKGKFDLDNLISDQLRNQLLNNPPVSPDVATEDPCRGEGARNCFFIHLKSGTRVYDAYSLMDGMAADPTPLAKSINDKLTGNAIT